MGVFDPSSRGNDWTWKKKFMNAVLNARRETIRKLRIKTWNDAYTYGNFTFVDTIDRCEVLHNVGIRVDRVWAGPVAVTQFPSTLTKKKYGREYLFEFVKLGRSNQVLNLPFKISLHPNATIPKTEQIMAREKGDGVPLWSTFREKGLCNIIQLLKQRYVGNKSGANRSATQERFPILLFWFCLAYSPSYRLLHLQIPQSLPL